MQASLKQREKLQVQAAKTEEALGKLQRLGTVSQISSLFAHELRQPLNAIRCYAYSLLKQTMKAGSNLDKEKFASGLEEINEQAQRADEIIQKVRDYVKDKSRDLTQVDLDQILKKTIESFSLGHPDCEIQVQAVSAKVLGDPLEIELIISNLIKNAYEASVGKKAEPQERQFSNRGLGQRSSTF
ncbi:histidine kinase dimerization/phospho-acceptor domain-containing protein [Parasutterella excrementihominis]|uniref:histidine kinase dimerization/phospho-acceptor domain-containing protein n=1 Tax=Parasutterella excrementihominis TaxID=487175 RepID=UPI003FEF5DD3